MGWRGHWLTTFFAGGRLETRQAKTARVDGVYDDLFGFVEEALYRDFERINRNHSEASNEGYER